MKWYITKRLLMLIPVLLGVSILSFSLIHLAPGDPALTIAGERASPQIINAIREKYGLDKPLSTQYQYSIFDYSFMGVALFGISMPVFWLGIMLMMIFGVYLRWLPISGRISMMISFQRVTGFYLLDSLITGNFAAFISSLRYLILPSVALSTIPMATIARVTRSSMLEVLRQDFIRTERAKGLSERMVIYKHAVRNAMIPVITVIGLNFGLLLAGAILTETVFSWPGIGRYVVNAINMRDYPVVQGCVLFFALMFVIVNLITDIVYVYIDPRIHYG
jgi:peptide/nickel transport system permease protein